MKFSFFIFCCLFFKWSAAQKVIPLYERAIPGSKKAENYVEKAHIGGDGKRYISFVSNPTLTVFASDKPNGTAVIICPGGGYGVLAIEHEGEELAKRFNEFGVTAFVLKYRLPSPLIMEDPTIGPLQDLQQAILLIREGAKKWNIDPHKIGLVGASAGGHLAASAAVHFIDPVLKNANINLRPDFLVLLYPRISLVIGSESSSAKNLLGPEFKPTLMNFFSVDKHVTNQTPPTFLVHAGDDQVVKVEHSILFYEMLIKHKIPAEMHLLQAGGHGFGLNNKMSSADWFLSLISWLKDNHFTN